MPGDDVNRIIGRLEAESDSSQRQRKDLFDKVDETRKDMHNGLAEIRKEMTDGFTEMRSLMSPLASLPSHVKSHCDDLKVLTGYVQRFKGALWAGKAVWVLLVAICGAGAWLYSDQKAAAKENADRFSVVWSAINRIAPVQK